MKALSDILFIVQARLGSQRVPKKMIRSFNNTTLLDIILDKLINSSIIPRKQVYCSVHEKELIDIVKNKKGFNIFKRSYESANNDSDITKIFEWHDKLPFKYVIIISACNPLLKVDTIEAFVKQFVEQEEDNLFGVIEKNQYFWNKEGIMVTPWPEGQTLMNTKAVEPTYEAAHVLYASPMGLIKENRYMGDFSKPGGIKLFKIDELEAFDIDYEWQFKAAEILYSNGDLC